jgi:hypothetical protein
MNGVGGGRFRCVEGWVEVRRGEARGSGLSRVMDRWVGD